MVATTATQAARATASLIRNTRNHHLLRGELASVLRFYNTCVHNLLQDISDLREHKVTVTRLHRVGTWESIRRIFTGASRLLNLGDIGLCGLLGIVTRSLSLWAQAVCIYLGEQKRGEKHRHRDVALRGVEHP